MQIVKNTTILFDPESLFEGHARIIIKKSRKSCDLQDSIAEREGFEPPVPLGTTVFKTVVIDHSTISPINTVLTGLHTLKASAKVFVFFVTTKLFSVFLKIISAFFILWINNVVTLHYDLSSQL